MSCRGGAVIEAGPGPVVQLVGYFLESLFADEVEVGTHGEVLA